jgi:glucose-1-phosphate thymidylyltransferase
MKGIVLAGGSGTRLGPVTRAINKHLLPIYDKPMIYYPLTTLILAGVRDITFLSTPDAIPNFKKLLGDGSQWGINISYCQQDFPSGIAGGLKIAALAGGDEETTLVILGDNIFFGQGLGRNIADIDADDHCHVWTQTVRNPESFGIAEIDSRGEVLRIVEKPLDNIGNSAVTGLYKFPAGLLSKLDGLKPSNRNELEITDVLGKYLFEARLSAHNLTRGVYWLDAGTIENLGEVSQFVRAIQTRQGQLIGSPDEAAFRVGRISETELAKLINDLPESDYKTSLRSVLNV